MCRVEFVLTDGSHIYNMEKTFQLPCWMQEGMKLEFDLWSSPEVSYVTTDPMRCTQNALLRNDLKCRNAEDLRATLKLWIADDWAIESEDCYT